MSSTQVGSETATGVPAAATVDSTEGRVAGPDPKRSDHGSWASFSDPDGNGWLLQEITTRLPGREWED